MRIFISHSSADRDVASRLARELQRCGMKSNMH